MLTRLRVQGFKNLLDVDVRFGPFTCVAGLNGAGKSNLFDAIRFLNLLTKHPIMQAVQLLRETKGRSPEPRSLFTEFEGYLASELRFTAEMIVDQHVQDDFGVADDAAISTLRYEVAFRLASDDGFERLALIYESLTPIALGKARRTIGFPTSRDFRESTILGRRVVAFVSTPSGTEITVHQEGHGGRKVPAPKSQLTVIGGMASSDFPSILAANREMASWQTLLLEPSAMRSPSFYTDPRTIDSRGTNLPGTIHRLQKQEQQPGKVYAELANQLSQLIEDIEELRVRDDPKTESLTLEVRARNGVFHPARSLSDGTLRFLVLATLSLDPEAKGMICLEEPENGIHPERIPTIITLLREIAVDPDYKVDPDNPLRQVVVNTHSPSVVQEIAKRHPGDLVYMDEEYVLVNGAKGRVAAAFAPASTWREKLGSRCLAPGRLLPYRPGEQLLFPSATEMHTGT
ncbi:MAG: AAA family ATPase [Planctomycetota bacterium]|nr:AAA family ATPase [Planctomycetota bacterium]